MIIHWKGISRIEFIQSGLGAFVNEIERLRITSVAVPPLGCGLGSLRWAEVKREIESTLGELSDVDVLVFGPAGEATRIEDEDCREKTQDEPRPCCFAGTGASLRGSIDGRCSHAA